MTYPCRIFFFILAFCLSCGMPQPAWARDMKPTLLPLAQTSAEAAPSEHSYIIGPQNLLQIKIYGEASNQIYRVDEVGCITHTLLGRVKLGGMTVTDAEKMLESSLSGDYIINPHVNIFVLEHSHFSVLGEVKKPGSYEILGRVSVIEAISMAGGFTPVASQGAVKIIRKSSDKEATIHVDTTKITGQGDTSEDAYVEADDVIVIPKSFF